ncbi:MULTISPECIES: hypothetical protein [unclassified Variovorax]|uniref:hypothetical protein n=1 Tax=unclassified Variovorax TaxID=663243 RepID=UPI001319B16D|nr:MULTISPECIES: hypothetical protein [unclassified Variovorax]VTU42708.1 hypothetical protein H6P1_00259 [Variovorax sp. PBL-H6]VTU43738.1 hypothetical protein SRS16P1_00645 [Variovorax sp. SRS16]VTU43803.1 hypothetical protein E5P1_00639 [Variovorax sp. PBL-E5]
MFGTKKNNMPRIRNLAQLDDESLNLEVVLEEAPTLWEDLLRKGYEVTMPDMLGFSAPHDISWFIEVGESRTTAYMWSQRARARVGNRFIVDGAPAAAVAEAQRLLEGVAMEESLSGAPLYAGVPVDEHVTVA